ncbi:MAG: acyl-CoA reductase [Pseudomonadota bacterium]
MDSKPLDRKILRLMETDEISGDAFNSLALEVFAHQYEGVEPYRRFCDTNHATPESVRHYSKIPPYPTAGFKRYRLASFPARDVVATFQTSGTTEAETGTHVFNTLELYDRACVRSFERFVLEPAHGAAARFMCLSLIPSDLDAPRSSLAHMVATLARAFSNGDVTYAVQNGGVDPVAAQEAFVRSKRTETPLWIAATSIALSDLLLFLKSRNLSFRLPPGSFLFETGGRKGRRFVPSPVELSQLSEELLGISATSYFAEYGMTEISSPAWTRLDGEHFTYESPAWAPYRIVNPRTLEEPSPGNEGMIAVFDVANRGSVSSLLTGDWGRRHKTGFEVLGRVAAAEIRGCSLQTIHSPQVATRTIHAKPNFSGIASTAQNAPSVSLAESIKVLGDLAKKWLDPAFPPRREFEISLRESRYFSQGSATEGLNLTFEALGEKLLTAAAERAWKDKRPNTADRFLVQISAGNLPVTGVFPFFASLLCGIPSIHRPSLRSGNLLDALHRSLATIHPAFASRAAVVSTDSGDDAVTRDLLAPATTAILQGDNDTIEHLSVLAPSRARIVAYGPKFSAAILPRGITPTEKEWDLLAQDILIWEQQGCLSPQALFLHAPRADECENYANAFSQAFLKRSCEWERKPHPRSLGALRWHAFDQNFRQANGLAIAFSDRLRTDWFATPGLIQWIQYKDERDLVDLLSENLRHLSSLALPSSAQPQIERLQERFHNVRITTWGRLQAPEFDWPQDGHDRLRSLF